MVSKSKSKSTWTGLKGIAALKHPMTPKELSTRGAAVGLFSNFGEGDVLNLERQKRAKAVGIDPNSTEAQIQLAESKKK